MSTQSNEANETRSLVIRTLNDAAGTMTRIEKAKALREKAAPEVLVDVMLGRMSLDRAYADHVESREVVALPGVVPEDRHADVAARSAELLANADGDFPEVPVGRGLTVQLMWMTPERAEQLLARKAEGQRDLKTEHFAMLVDEILEQRWMLNGETISIDWNGVVINGYHRLTTIIDTGVALELLVVRRVDPRAQTTFDNNAKRSGADALRAEGFDYTTRIQAAVKLIQSFDNTGDLFAGRRKVVSPGKTVQLARKYQGPDDDSGIVHSVKMALPFSQFKKGSAVYTACHYVLSHIRDGVYAAKVDEFYSLIATGANLPEDSPILALRHRLNEKVDRRDAKIAEDEIAYLVFKAWTFFRDGKPARVLKRGKNAKLPAL